jgi:hypothetical protein
MKEALLKFLNTLLFSWGGDTPPEAIWAANDFLELWELNTGVTFPTKFVEDDVEEANSYLLIWIQNNL